MIVKEGNMKLSQILNDSLIKPQSVPNNLRISNKKHNVAVYAIDNYLHRNPGIINNKDQVIHTIITKYLPPEYRSHRLIRKDIVDMINILYNSRKTDLF